MHQILCELLQVMFTSYGTKACIIPPNISYVQPRVYQFYSLSLTIPKYSKQLDCFGSGATCTKLFSGHLRQYQDLRDDATKFCIHKANLRQKT